MRCWHVTGGFGRSGIVALCVTAVSAIAMMGPASARSHTHSHRHYHFAKRRGVSLHAESIAANYQYGFQPFTPAYANDRWARNNLSQSIWSQNSSSQNSRNANRRQSDSWNSWNGQSAFGGTSEIGGMAEAQASAAGVPISLVNRVIKRESGGNPRAVSRGNYGLMQIRLGTARAMGYTGSAAGLLDARTNMTYAVRYLAGAYRAAGGNESRAVALYARGYYDVARAQGFSPYASSYTGGSYQVASNYGAPSFGYQPQQWQSETPYGGARYRVRHFRHHPV